MTHGCVSGKSHIEDHRQKSTDGNNPSASRKSGKIKKTIKIIRIFVKRGFRPVPGKSTGTPKQSSPAGKTSSTPVNESHLCLQAWDIQPGGYAFIDSQALPDPLCSDTIGRLLVAKGLITDAGFSEALERKKQDPNKYMGQILSEMGFPQSRIMHEIYYSNKRKKLGEILVELEIITPEQLHETLIEQKHLIKKGTHVYLATLMIRNRIIKEEHYMNALSAHFSMPIISLKDFTVLPPLQKAIGERYALRSRIIVLENNNGNLSVAIAEPHLSVFDNLEKAVPKGKYISYYLARAMEIQNCLQKAYDFDF